MNAVAMAEVPTRAALQGLALLVADDNIVNQHVAAELLESAGAAVHLAANGREAIEVLAQHPIDCVLMDVHMPVMDGLQATRLIRALPSAVASVPVIALTADASPENRLECVDAAMDDFLTKPLSPELLYATIVARLRSRRDEAGSPVVAAVAAAVAAPAEVIDLAILLRYLGGNASKMRKVAFMFVDSMTETMTEIESAAAAGDWQSLSALGHRAKSSAATVGANRLAALLTTLQNLHGGDLAQATALTAEIAAMFDQVRQSIAASFDEPAPATPAA